MYMLGRIVGILHFQGFLIDGLGSLFYKSHSTKFSLLSIIGFVELGSYVESLHLEKVLLRGKSLWVRELPTSVPTWLLSQLLLTRGCSALLVPPLPEFFCTP